jgi:hypothetical protein
MAEKKFFAVVKKDGDYLERLIRAETSEELLPEFPAADYDIHDMTGKGNPPSSVGMAQTDLTVDAEGEWKVKDSAPDPQAAADAEELAVLKRNYVTFLLQKEKADALGSGFADLSADLDTKITETNARIQELEGS